MGLEFKIGSGIGFSVKVRKLLTLLFWNKLVESGRMMASVQDGKFYMTKKIFV